MIYTLDNVEIFGQFKTKDGTTYPSNWLDLSTEIEKQAINVITLTEIFPILNENESYDGSFIDNLQTLTRTYNKVTI